MFDVLLESRPRRENLALSKGSIGSLATHAAFVGLLAATAGGGALYLAGPIERAIFLAPLKREASKPAVEQVAYLAGGDGRAIIEGIEGLGSSDAILARGGRGAGNLRAGEGENQFALNEIPAPAVDVSPAFTEVQVDSIAERDPSSDAPAYPQRLLEAGVQGLTIVQFVVDSTGLLDLRSFREMHASHPLFTVSVYDALPRMRYKPATIGGRPVRQLVQQEFIFRIQAPSAPPKPAT